MACRSRTRRGTLGPAAGAGRARIDEGQAHVSESHSTAAVSYYAVIRGPLGVGKSTVSRRLCERLRAQYISIDRLLEDHGIEEWDEDRISLRSFLAANALAAAAARPLVAAGRPVVIDGCFYWSEQLVDLRSRLDAPGHFFTLDAPLEVCVARDATRPLPRVGETPAGGHQQGPQACRDVYQLVASVSYGERIDATGAIEETVATLLRRLEREVSPSSSSGPVP